MRVSTNRRQIPCANISGKAKSASAHTFTIDSLIPVNRQRKIDIGVAGAGESRTAAQRSSRSPSTGQRKEPFQALARMRCANVRAIDAHARDQPGLARRAKRHLHITAARRPTSPGPPAHTDRSSSAGFRRGEATSRRAGTHRERSFARRARGIPAGSRWDPRDDKNTRHTL